MASSNCKNQGSESHGYQAVITTPSWDELLGSMRLKTERQLNEEGWMGTLQLAKTYGTSPQHIGSVMRKKLEQGLVESTRGKLSGGNVGTFYRPKTASA